MMFSVIVPIYNREETISEVIESVLSQSYPEWELLLIDDGSTDRTAEICMKYSDQEPRIKYILKKNGGVSSARNCGIYNSAGDYILFLDSDNSLMSIALESLNNLICKYNDADLVVYGYYSSLVTQWAPDMDGLELIDHQSIREQIIPTHLNIHPQEKWFMANFVWNKVYNANLLKENSIKFDETRRTWEDGIFVIECLDKANSVLVYPAAIYNAYCHQMVEHLSSKLYIDQVLQYINDESNYKSRFEKEMDFTAEHYITANIHTIDSLFDKMVHDFGKQSESVIDIAIKSEIVQYWAVQFVPQNKKDQLLKKMILSKESAYLYGFYKPTLVKRAARKLIRLSKMMSKKLT